jgi:hypothetical protein
VIYKGNDNYYLMATTSNGGGQPAAGGTFGGINVNLYGPSALSLNTWTHLAGTYDGAMLRLYVNGVQVASQLQVGILLGSANPLQIGGDSIFGQTFQGQIDEVRVYSRALSAAEIQTDLATPLGSSGILPAAMGVRLTILGVGADGAVLLRADGQPDARFVIEASDDMVGWIPLGVVSDPAGVGFYTDTEAAGHGLRFYRIHEEP